jgi:hypothetical protein
VPGVKHYIHIERPAAIASEMNAFLAVREPVAEEAGPTAAKRR